MQFSKTHLILFVTLTGLLLGAARFLGDEPDKANVVVHTKKGEELHFQSVEEILGDGDARLLCTDDTGGTTLLKSYQIERYQEGNFTYLPTPFNAENGSGVKIFCELILEKDGVRLFRRYSSPTTVGMPWDSQKQYLNKGTFYILTEGKFEEEVHSGNMRKAVTKHFGDCNTWEKMVKKMRLNEANFGMTLRRFAPLCNAKPARTAKGTARNTTD